MHLYLFYSICNFKSSMNILFAIITFTLATKLKSLVAPKDWKKLPDTIKNLFEAKTKKGEVVIDKKNLKAYQEATNKSLFELLEIKSNKETIYKLF